MPPHRLVENSPVKWYLAACQQDEEDEITGVAAFRCDVLVVQGALRITGASRIEWLLAAIKPDERT